MPVITVADHACYYRLDGPADAPVVLFSHSLGMDHGMWDEQVAVLRPHLRVLRYDTRGHGASGAPVGDYRVDQLGRDVLGLVDALGVETFAFCGISLGGMIGQWLGAHASGRVTALVLANTTPRVAEPAAMETRRTTVLGRGLEAIVETALARFFSPILLEAGDPVVASARRTLLATDPAGYAGCCAAVRDFDGTGDLARIAVPTTIVAGDLDVSMPWEGNSRILAEGIAGATVTRLPAAHLSNLERPRSFSAVLTRALLPALTDADRQDAGMAVRRAVLGGAHVDRSSASATDFTKEFQRFITTTAWGTIWTRPGLDRRTRRLLVLAATAAQGRWEEYRLHVRTGLAHDLEPCDLEEVLLQVAIYAGVPAANTGFHIASEELRAAERPS